MPIDRRRRFLRMTWLTVLAITGLLFRHGLRVPATELAGIEAHSTHDDAAGGGVRGAVGLCAFAIVVGLIAATTTGPPNYPCRRRQSSCYRESSVSRVPARRRLRLLELCVMRA